MGAPSTVLYLGAHVYDVQRGELLQADGAPAPLRRQALQLLRVLAERPGEVVDKGALMDRVWPDVIVTEGSLTQAISEIRRALGDDGHRLICNVARRGYRLVPDAPLDQLPMLSMVVLPFEVIGGSDALQWIAAALHGDLIDELGRWRGCVVIARETSIRYGPAGDPRALARELSVRHVIGGRLRQEGPQVLLQLHRIDAASGLQTGQETMRLEQTELSKGISDLAIQLVRSLQPGLLADEAASARTARSRQPDPCLLAVQASALIHRGLTPQNLQAALQLLNRSVEMDPRDAQAWALLATATIQSLLNGWMPDTPQARERIDEAQRRLSLLDPDGPKELSVRVIQAYLRRDMRCMLRLARTLITRHRHPVHLGTLGIAALLNGRADEATQALQQALRLSPRDAMRAEWLNRLAVARYMVHDDQEALEYAECARDANPALRWPPVNVAALWQLGERHAASRALREHDERLPGVGPEQFEVRLPGDHPVLAETRQSLIDAVRAAKQAPPAPPSASPGPTLSPTSRAD